jgi:tRNA (cytidine/uridine-2'-O-)-methyltransferase
MLADVAEDAGFVSQQEPGPGRTGGEADHTLQIVLVHPEIAWNTGNAGRTCLAVGAQLHLVRPLGFSLDERELRRAGLDYWEHVRPVVWPDWASFARQMHHLGQAIAFSAEGDRELWSVRFPSRAVLIFGRESNGLPAELRRDLRAGLVRIPMRDSAVRSLNLSTAVAVAAYEARRQQLSAQARG